MIYKLALANILNIISFTTVFIVLVNFWVVVWCILLILAQCNKHQTVLCFVGIRNQYHIFCFFYSEK